MPALITAAQARGERELVAAEPLGGAQAGLGVVGVEAVLHARFVVGRREHVAEHLEHAAFDLGAAILRAPGLAHQRRGAGAVALGEQRARQHVAALGGRRLPVRRRRRGPSRRRLVVPQRVLGAAAEQRDVRPGRIGGDEGRVAGVSSASVLSERRMIHSASLRGDRVGRWRSRSRRPRRRGRRGSPRSARLSRRRPATASRGSARRRRAAWPVGDRASTACGREGRDAAAPEHGRPSAHCARRLRHGRRASMAVRRLLSGLAGRRLRRWAALRPQAIGWSFDFGGGLGDRLETRRRRGLGDMPPLGRQRHRLSCGRSGCGLAAGLAAAVTRRFGAAGRGPSARRRRARRAKMAAAMTAMVRPQGLRSVPPVKLRLKVPPRTNRSATGRCFIRANSPPTR